MMTTHAMVGAVVGLAVVAAATPASASSLWEGNPKNGLSSGSFLRNPITTNRNSLALLRARPLDDALLRDPHVARQLHHAHGEAAMVELIRCALDGATALTYDDPLDGSRQRWSGELGLCTGAAGDWHRAPPTEACLQLVTACMAARVNALGQSIPLSLRVVPPADEPLRTEVPVETRFRESPDDVDPSVGEPIGPFGGPACLVGRECHWMPALVGKCRPGTQVTLAIADPAGCAVPMRVCGGIHGCQTPSSGWPWPDEFPDPPYSTVLAERPSACASAPVTFRCPDDLPVAGYYSVMVKPPYPPPPPPGTPIGPRVAPAVVKLQGTGSYPASEAAVFTFREGAFYGNLFQPDRLTRNCAIDPARPWRLLCAPLDGTPVPERCRERGYDAFTLDSDGCPEPALAVPYRDVYACFTAAQGEQSTDDSDGVAYLNDRICNEPDPTRSCFPRPPRRCHFSDPQLDEERGAHCELVGGVYLQCEGGLGDLGSVYRPITTYLNEPCDLLGAGEHCTALRRSLETRGGAGRPIDPGPRHCGGCSTGEPLAGGALAGLAALLLRRRRRGAGVTAHTAGSPSRCRPR